MLLLLHLCKKYIPYDIDPRVTLYLGGLFLVSFIGDYVSCPETYFAGSENTFNDTLQHIVGYGHRWWLSSHILFCGNRKIGKSITYRTGLFSGFPGKNNQFNQKNV